MAEYIQAKGEFLKLEPLVNEDEEDEEKRYEEKNVIQLKLDTEDKPKEFVTACDREFLERHLSKRVAFFGFLDPDGELVIRYFIPEELFDKVIRVFPDVYADDWLKRFTFLSVAEWFRFEKSSKTQSDVFDLYSLVGKFLEKYDNIPEECRKEIIKSFSTYELAAREDRPLIAKVLRCLINFRYSNMTKIPDKDPEQILERLDRSMIGQNRAKTELLEIYLEAVKSGQFKKNVIVSGDTGKTTLVNAFADSVGLPVFDSSVCGMKDSISLRGNSRAWANGDPGTLFTKILGFNGPGIIVLDGVDEVKEESVVSALSDLVASNKKIFNEFLEVTIDLSNVLVIAVCKEGTESLPRAMVDGNHKIVIESYSTEDKKQIIKKAICNSGFDISFDDAAIECLLSRFGGEKCIKTMLQYVEKTMKNGLLSSIDVVTKDNLLSIWGNSKDLSALRTKDIHDFEELKVKFFSFLDDYPDSVKPVIERILSSEPSNRTNHDLDVLYKIVNILNDRESIYFDPSIVLKQLETTHFGMKPAKKSLIKAFYSLIRKKTKGCFGILLVGPPGVGKTTIVESFAQIVGIPFSRISMNEIRTENELLGISPSVSPNPSPGKLLDAFVKAKSYRTLICLDEVEKTTYEVFSSFLGAIDPSQGGFFNRYLDAFIPTDQALFVATCNDASDLPNYVKSRFMLVEMSDYSETEIKTILHEYIVPEFNSEYSTNFEIDEDAISLIVKNSESSGVRDVKKTFENIFLEQLCFGRKDSSVITAKMVQDVLDEEADKNIRKIGFF